MTLDDYLREQATYAEFAATVVRIIEAGLGARPDVARPLAMQSRAKDPVSLRSKLSQRGLLDADSIETEIKDLAGCRLIFYTNSDADRFLQSRIVFDNFVVDWDNTKIHHAVGAEPTGGRALPRPALHPLDEARTPGAAGVCAVFGDAR